MHLEQIVDYELDILRLVAQGANNKEIATQLRFSERTIGNRLGIIYQKLHVSNRTQAAIYALRQGWASLEAEEFQIGIAEWGFLHKATKNTIPELERRDRRRRKG